MSHYLGNNTALCKTIYGHKMYVDTRDLSIAPHLLEDGVWEKWVTDAMAVHFPNSVFFDIGANFGWFSCAAHRFGAKEVHAFEPNPVLFSLLCKTMTVNGFENTTLTKAALSDHDGIDNLCFDPDFFGGGTLVSNPGDVYEPVETYTFEETEVAKAVRGTGAQCVFKIDVEGSEGKIVLGAREFITAHNCTFFIEKNDDPSGALRMKEMHDFLHQQKYLVGHCNKAGGVDSIAYLDIPNIPSSDMLCFWKAAR